MADQQEHDLLTVERMSVISGIVQESFDSILESLEDGDNGVNPREMMAATARFMAAFMECFSEHFIDGLTVEQRADGLLGIANSLNKMNLSFAEYLIEHMSDEGEVPEATQEATA